MQEPTQQEPTQQDSVQQEPTQQESVQQKVRELYRAAGSPSLARLAAVAGRAGYHVSKSALWSVLQGKNHPRLETVEAFVAGCASWARSCRPPIPLPPEQVDLAAWRSWHAQGRAQPSGPPDARTAAAGRKAPALAPGPTAMTCTLPADTGGFTGRDAQISQILAALAGPGPSPVAQAIAIDGMPGAGKTALAVHLAHLLGDRYPDLRLFLDLHAHTPGAAPMPAEEALATLLAADGLDPAQLPPRLDDRAALWRDRTAGRRVLVVLDNAAGTAQVAPLLPAGGGCLALVTSRNHLGDLPVSAPAIQLEAMGVEHAVEMFIRLTPRAATDDLDAALELVTLCGRLPLAISLLARVYNLHRTWRLRDLIRETRARLLHVSVENSTVAAALEVSYQQLSPDRQRFLRRLGLSPGAEIEAHAAAALTGTSLAEATDQIDALHAANLLSEHSYRRYRMHDLIREYARALAGADPEAEREQAIDRLLDYYQQVADRADALVVRLARPGRASRRPDQPPPAGPELTSRPEALTWLRSERTTLLACVRYARATGRHRQVAELTAGLAGLLEQDGPWADAVQLHQHAVAAAEHAGDRRATANAAHDLGRAHYWVDDYQQAVAALERSLALYRTLSDQLGEANAWCSLGNLARVIGDLPRAQADLTQALELYRAIGDRGGEATTLWALSHARCRLAEDHPGATDLAGQALAIYEQLGDDFGQGRTLWILADMCRLRGDYPAARACLDRSLAHLRADHDRLGTAMSLTTLAQVATILGDFAEATALLREALAVHRELGNRIGVACVLRTLAEVHQGEQNYPEAIACCGQAMVLLQEARDRLGEAELLNIRGAVQLSAGNVEPARADYRLALDLAAAGDMIGEKACALAGLGRCARANGDLVQARELLGRALAVHQQLGTADAITVAADLAALPPG